MSLTYENKGAAKRYDAARELPEETSALWMMTLARALPPGFAPNEVLDLGAGTGRFTLPLHRTFHCQVHAVEPAEAMMAEGQRNKAERIAWHRGAAESIPLETDSLDLVWMSQTFHHLDRPDQAFHEIRRVLRPGGCLSIRNGTQENNVEIEWMRCFPDADQIDKGRLPSQQDVVDLVSGHGYVKMSAQTVRQYFAASCDEYFHKISRRGLSSLIAISDEAFEAGLLSLRDWVDRQPPDTPVYEPIDLFVFRVNEAGDRPTTEANAS